MRNIKIYGNVKLLITNTSPAKNIRLISDMMMTDMGVLVCKMQLVFYYLRTSFNFISFLFIPLINTLI
jgi:hypothetical protein